MGRDWHSQPSAAARYADVGTDGCTASGYSIRRPRSLWAEPPMPVDAGSPTLCVLKARVGSNPRRRFMTFIQLRPQDTYGKASDLDVAEPSKSAGSGAPGLIQSDSVKQLNYDIPLADRSHSGHQRKPFRLGARRFLKEVGKPTCWREPARSATTRPGPMQLQTLVLSCRDRQAMAPQSSDEHSPANVRR